MSTTPPEQPAGQYQSQPAAGRSTGQGMPFMPMDMARMPFPGNAEWLVWVLALIVAALVAAVADSVDTPAWFSFFTWTTVAYLLSRGVAKATRVLEH